MHKRPSIFASTLVLLLAHGTAFAASPVAQVTRVTWNGASATISGIWPSTCQPQIEAVDRRGDGLGVLLGNAGTLCEPSSQPFSLELGTGADDAFSPAMPTGRTLQIFARNTTAGEPVLVGFRMADAGHPMQPEAGFWWPVEKAAGSVLALEVQGDALGASLMTYDNQGNPLWYFGTTRLQGDSTHIELARMEGGLSVFSGSGDRAPLPQSALGMDVRFLSATKARVVLSKPTLLGGIELTAFEVMRVPFSESPQMRDWLGPWLVAASPDSANALPRQLTWTESTMPDPTHTVLHDTQSGFSLRCSHQAGPASVAQRCALHDPDGMVVARFDQVGLDRLDGVDPGGAATILIRQR